MRRPQRAGVICVIGWMMWSSVGAVRPVDAAEYTIQRTDDRVTEIRVKLKSGTLVLDRFVDDEDFVLREQKKFALSAADDANCAALGGASACERSCYWAAKARPAKRVRHIGTDGKTRWTWQARANDARITLQHAALTQAEGAPAIAPGECVSPDEKFIATAAYLPNYSRGNPVAAAATSSSGYGISKIAPRFPTTKVVGPKTREPFGHPRFTQFIGWQQGAPHAVVFDVTRPERDNQSVTETAQPK
jgi:hypothetical protein